MKLLTILPFVLPLLSAPAFAEDIQTIAPVRAVTMYPNGATLTRVISADVPAGAHRILFPISQEALTSGPPRIRSKTGFAIGAQEYLPDYITDATQVYSPSQLVAYEKLDALQDQRIELEALIASGSIALEAAQAQVAFVRSISGKSLSGIDATDLSNTTAMIGEQISTALAALHSARSALRGDEEALQELDKAIAQAERDFARTAPPRGSVGMMAVSVDLASAQTIEFTLDYLIRQAGWGVDYDLFLDRDANTLDISRKVLVQQFTDEVWSDVELIMSTADPSAQIVPSEQYPNQASIFDRANKRNVSAPTASIQLERGVADATMEIPIINEDAETFARVAIDGLSVTYSYPEPVTISPDEGTLILALDEFQLDAEEFNRAVPRIDKTAFLMAKFTNTTPEPILAGTTSLYRDGKFVGRGRVAMIPAGAEETLAFGSLDGLRLEYKRLNNDTGDTGIISRADTREQALEFSVENLTGETETIEALFALPFSEQEDLVVSSRARPKPDTIDFEKRRNVGQWLLELKPGEKRTVRVDVDMSWPQGQILQWQP